MPGPYRGGGRRAPTRQVIAVPPRRAEGGAMTTDTSTLTAVVDTYIDMWNEADADRRADLIRTAWADDARYRDPLLEADGHAGLSEMVATVHGHYPGHRFR